MAIPFSSQLIAERCSIRKRLFGQLHQVSPSGADGVSKNLHEVARSRESRLDAGRAGKASRFLSSLVLCFIISGCQVEATLIADQMEAEIDAATHRADQCFNVAINDPTVSRIKTKLLRSFYPPSPPQLSNENRANQAERAALFRYSDLIGPCRQIIVDTLEKTHALSATAYVKAYTRIDAVYAQLVTQKTAWDSANKRLAAIYDSLKVETVRLGSLYRRNLREAHIIELQQRLAATTAMQRWAAQQQVLRSLTPTQHADCSSPGRSFSCASE